MLRSIIKTLTQSKRNATQRLDIHMTSHHCNAELRSNKSGQIWKEQWPLELDFNAFEDKRLNNVALNEAINDISKNIGSNAPLITLVLPDHLFTHGNTRLAEIPEQQKELDRLVRWKLSEDFEFNLSKFFISYQLFEKRVSAFWLPKVIVKTLHKAFVDKNLLVQKMVPHSIQLATNLQVTENRFIWIDPPHYSITAFDSNDNVSLFQTGMHSMQGEDFSKTILNRAHRLWLMTPSSDEHNHVVALLTAKKDTNNLPHLPGYSFQTYIVEGES